MLAISHGGSGSTPRTWRFGTRSALPRTHGGARRSLDRRGRERPVAGATPPSPRIATDGGRPHPIVPVFGREPASPRRARRCPDDALGRAPAGARLFILRDKR